MPKIISNDKISSDYYYMKIKAPEIAVKGLPGQFVHIKVNSDDQSFDPLLRRPFSFFDIDKENGIIEIAYCIVGRGTRILSGYKSQKLDILGPLGNSFNYTLKNKNIFIIGGGMGIAPLYYLSKKLSKENKVNVLLGGNTGKDLRFFINKFQKLSLNLKTATMDGSRGFKGTVTELWQDSFDLNKIDYLFSCGPEPMLKEIKDTADRYEIQGEVSLEERMGCGIGVCLSCTCKTKEGNKRICTSGPVLPLEEVIFDD